MQLLAYTPSLRGELILDGGRLQKAPQLPDQFAYVSGIAVQRMPVPWPK
jgi:hypothetical protein